MTEKPEEKFLQRCLDLGKSGAGNVSPNPMVGAILVYEDAIIGEGFHEIYGGAHAEVNAFRQAEKLFADRIADATLYVSLEPCSIFGKTPPCSDLIIEKKVKKVVVATLDQTPEVNGNGVKKLSESGVEVNITGGNLAVNELSAIRNTFAAKNRPYVILKFAQSNDGFIGRAGEKIWLTNAFSKRLVHKWRSETDAIMIGTKTALTDDPELTTRLYFGKSPVRILLDKNLIVPSGAKIFNSASRTLVVTEKEIPPDNPAAEFLQLPFDENLLPTVLTELAKRKITSLLVEGGAKTIQAFLDKNLWDEARIFKTESNLSSGGIQAPKIGLETFDTYQLLTDKIERYRNFDPF